MPPLENSKLSPSISLSLTFLFCVALYFIHYHLDSLEPLKHISAQTKRNFSIQPKDGFISEKNFTFGFDLLLADYHWLQFVQEFGKSQRSQFLDTHQNPIDYGYLYYLADTVTDLDPQFDLAYKIAGLVLAQYGNEIELSNKILEKGLPYSQRLWEIPFYLGFNHFYFLNDSFKAAKYLEIASRHALAPKYFPHIVSRLYSEAQTPETALAFIDSLKYSENDPITATRYESWALELLTEKDLQYIDRQVARFKDDTGYFPMRLTDLIVEGYLPFFLKEYHGGYYYLDENSVAQSSEMERLKLYRKPKSQ